MYDYLVLSAFILQTIGFGLLFYKHQVNTPFLVANLIAMAVFSVQSFIEGKHFGALIFFTNFVFLTLMLRNELSNEKSTQ